MGAADSLLVGRRDVLDARSSGNRDTSRSAEPQSNARIPWRDDWLESFAFRMRFAKPRDSNQTRQQEGSRSAEQ